MSLSRRTNRSQLSRAMRRSCTAFGGSWPAVPLSNRPSDPRIAVSGVRSSWETVDTNSLFIRSSRFQPLMSRMIVDTDRSPFRDRWATITWETGISWPRRVRMVDSPSHTPSRRAAGTAMSLA